MAEVVEFHSVDELLKDSEVINYNNEGSRQFKYELGDKQTKAKLMKGARRSPFEAVKNTGSVNLIFNLGSWNNVVLPSITYWDKNKENKKC